MSKGIHAFFQQSNEIMRRLQETQEGPLTEAAELIANSIAGGGLLFALGTGHSYYLAGEAFARAGGLWPVQMIACSNLSMVDGSARSSRTERLEGYAACILADYDMRAGDVLLAISNSGRNAVPLEACLYARERGLKTIALTNVAHSQAESSRHSSGKRLAEVADIVLDNCGVHGDSAVSLPGLPYAVGPTSTVTGALLVNAMITQVVANLIDRGIEPPILVSANVDVPNRQALYQRYAAFNRPLKHR